MSIYDPNSPYAPAYLDDRAADISLQLQREEFASNPPALQAARRRRVRELLAAERARGQRSPSYLARHAREIYGVE